MVTVLYRQRHGYDVRIHTDDHFPAHVHVWRDNRELIVELRKMRIRKNKGFNSREVRQILALLREHESLLRETWLRWHGTLG